MELEWSAVEADELGLVVVATDQVDWVGVGPNELNWVTDEAMGTDGVIIGVEEPDFAVVEADEVCRVGMAAEELGTIIPCDCKLACVRLVNITTGEITECDEAALEGVGTGVDRFTSDVVLLSTTELEVWAIDVPVCVPAPPSWPPVPVLELPNSTKTTNIATPISNATRRIRAQIRTIPKQQCLGLLLRARTGVGLCSFTSSSSSNGLSLSLSSDWSPSPNTCIRGIPSSFRNCDILKVP